MTVIVAVAQKGDVWMGADSKIGAGNVRRHVNNKKLFRTGPLLVGPAGVARPYQLMQYLWKAPERELHLDALEYLATVAMPSLQSFFREQQVLSKESDGECVNGSMLIACDKRLFRSDGYFNISEYCPPYAAIGSGEEPALGVLYHAHQHQGSMKPEEMLTAALEASAYFHDTVAPPFQIERLGEVEVKS